MGIDQCWKLVEQLVAALRAPRRVWSPAPRALEPCGAGRAKGWAAGRPAKGLAGGEGPAALASEWLVGPGGRPGWPARGLAGLGGWPAWVDCEGIGRPAGGGWGGACLGCWEVGWPGLAEARAARGGGGRVGAEPCRLGSSEASGRRAEGQGRRAVGSAWSVDEHDGDEELRAVERAEATGVSRSPETVGQAGSRRDDLPPDLHERRRGGPKSWYTLQGPSPFLCAVHAYESPSRDGALSCAVPVLGP
jgi:hypothetical protein